MKFTRRGFIAGATAAISVNPSVTLADGHSNRLVAGEEHLQLLPTRYDRTSVWTFNGQTPGPEIRVLQGETINQTLANQLPQPTSIHWHGIRLENSMDGVAGLTQIAVDPGNSFEYNFTAPDAGTFWYHAHNNSSEQVGRGLYGPLIVQEPDAIDVDREEVLVLDDWLVDPETAQISANFQAGHDMSHSGRLGNYITTNGQFKLELGARQNERMRLRLINASNARVFSLSLNGLKGWVMAMDGMPLPKPLPVENSIVLGPAQRIDLVVDVIASPGSLAHIAQSERGEQFSQVAFSISESVGAARTAAPEPLPPNPTTPYESRLAKKITLKMEGGAMGGLQTATLGGTQMSMREIVGKGRYWAFNGAADGFEGPPLAHVNLGENVRLSISNETAFPHAMHLHGMHFYEVNADGELGFLRDTTLVMRGETKEIAFVADNPGEWLFHCHMLSHAASGMSARIVVG